MFMFLEIFTAVSTGVFVSKVSGQNRDGCGLHSHPCQSISFALRQATEGTTVYLDGTGTASSPYPCDVDGLGTLIVQSISLVGINSRAHISCQRGKHWLVDGRKHKSELHVTFKNLAFQKTSVEVLDASLRIEDCIFSRTETTAIRISSFNLSRLSLSLDGVAFERNKACILLESKANQRNNIIVSINNSTFKSNGARNVRMPTKQDSIFVFNTINGTIQIAIRKSVFFENSLWTNTRRSGGLFRVKNEHGLCNISIENSNFTNNGLHERTTQTGNLFFLTSSTLLVKVGSTHVVNTSSARFLYFAGESSKVWVYNNATFHNFDIRKKDFNYGGVFSMNALIKTSLFIEDCFVNNIGTARNGGFAYVNAPNINITIRRSSIANVKTKGKGGAFYIKTLRRNVTPLKGMDTPTIWKGEKLSLKKTNALLHVTDTYFLQNKAASTGGAVYFKTNADTMIIFHNATFVENTASAGGAIYTESTKATPFNSLSRFNFNVSKSNFTANIAHGQWGGGAIYVVFGTTKSTIVFNQSSFFKNQARHVGSYGGAVLLLNNTEHFANIYIVKSNFEKNSAAYGGALSIPKKSQIVLSCKGSIFQGNIALAFPELLQRAPDMSYVQHLVFTMHVKNTSYGGAIFIRASNSKISFASNTKFIENKCSDNMGGAVYAEVMNSTTFNVTNTTFGNNSAINDQGGAIALVMSYDHIIYKGCLDPNALERQRSWIYLNKATFRNVKFINNVASGGSALYVINGEMVLNTCLFSNNFALYQSGHLSSDGSNKLTIQNAIFNQTSYSFFTTKKEYALTSFIDSFSGGPLNIRNSTFDHYVNRNNHPLISVNFGGEIELDKFTTVSCPVGANVTKRALNFTKMDRAFCHRKFSLLLLSCNQCRAKDYSLQRGTIRGLEDQNNFTCHPCPRGANCFPTIKAKPNFWGYIKSRNPLTLAFTLCPVGYCKSPSRNTTEFNECQGHRTGKICGSCSDGYTEELSSANCRLTTECNDYWFWVPFVVIVFLIAAYLVFKPAVPKSMKKKILWFMPAEATRTVLLNHEEISEEDGAQGANNSLENVSNEDERNKHSETSGFLEIIFYYYQIAYLLLNSYDFDEINSKIVSIVLSVFNFQPEVSHVSLTCPLPGLTPLTKKIFQVSPVFATLLAIWIIFGIHSFISLKRRNTSPHIASYLAATMETLLLGYTTIANFAFSLVICVPIGSETRWFYNGNVECYQPWQKAALAFIAIFVAPFILILAWASRKVENGEVSAKELFLATIFPLPWLFLWIVRAPQGQGTDENGQPDYALNEMKVVLSGPFHVAHWQSIIIGRRFVLVILYTFINDPTLRLFSMTLFNVFVLFTHVSVKPFKSLNNLKSIFSANHIESLSLFILVALGLMNMHRSVYIGKEVNVDGNLATIFNAYDVVQIIAISFLPAVALLIVLLAILSLVIHILLRVGQLTAQFLVQNSSCCKRPDSSYEHVPGSIEPSV